MKRRSLHPWLVAAGLGLLAACGVSAEQQARPVDDESVPFGLLDRDVAPLLPPATGADSERAPLCFVQDDKLVEVDSTLKSPVALSDVIDALVEPPGRADSALRTAVGEPPLVGDVRAIAGVAEVDLLASIADLGGEEQLLAVAQIVCTLTGQPGVGPVSFTLDGAPIEIPRGDGSLTSEPVSRDDYSNLLS